MRGSCASMFSCRADAHDHRHPSTRNIVASGGARAALRSILTAFDGPTQRHFGGFYARQYQFYAHYPEVPILVRVQARNRNRQLGKHKKLSVERGLKSAPLDYVSSALDIRTLPKVQRKGFDAVFRLSGARPICAYHDSTCLRSSAEATRMPTAARRCHPLRPSEPPDSWHEWHL